MQRQGLFSKSRCCIYPRSGSTVYNHAGYGSGIYHSDSLDLRIMDHHTKYKYYRFAVMGLSLVSILISLMVYAEYEVEFNFDESVHAFIQKSRVNGIVFLSVLSILIALMTYAVYAVELNMVKIQQPILTATMEVPNAVLPKLLCENCDGYLSRGPVHLMDNDKYRCGRCLPSDEEHSTRIEVYEELAKLMTFPCKYQENGCLSKVPFVANEAHEEACPYREYICPVAESGQCEWTGIQTELLQHCRQNHPDNVVENPCKFTHNITRSSLNNYLLWTLGVLFLIQTKVCTATRQIYHSVRLIGDPASAANYKYTLCIQNKDSDFCKQREVAPRGCLALQNDSSIQTDINALLTMLQDFTDTTFTVTIESVENGTTESSTAEQSSQGISCSNTHSPVVTVEARVRCFMCGTSTEPVYRGGWLCRSHAPRQRPCWNRTEGCTYSDVNTKRMKHMTHYCQYRARCKICLTNIVGMTRDTHYTQAHGDIIHRAGTMFSVSVECSRETLIIDSDVGRLLCWYGLVRQQFVFWVHTHLPSEQLYKYKCTMEFSHPDTGHKLTRAPPPTYDSPCDWQVRITDFNQYSQNDKVMVKINVNKIDDSL